MAALRRQRLSVEALGRELNLSEAIASYTSTTPTEGATAQASRDKVSRPRCRPMPTGADSCSVRRCLRGAALAGRGAGGGWWRGAALVLGGAAGHPRHQAQASAAAQGE